MGKVQQRFLIGVLAFTFASTAGARRFYDDDPIWTMPKPLSIEKANPRKLSDMYDFFYMTFGKPGEKHTPDHHIPAGAVNTLGEVPDSSWYVNRHSLVKRMSKEQLLAGPGVSNAPSTEESWRVVAAKTEGVTPGLTIQDSRKRRYLLKFDSPANPELATGYDVAGAKFFHNLGYYTPENYLVYFNPEQLVVDPKARLVDYRGVERNIRQSDIQGILNQVPRDPRGRYRAVASLFVEGKPIGPFRYHGTRADDPNDIVPHEHRRDLRGLYVFSAWLNHTDTKSLNSLDTVVEEKGIRYIRHYLIDFGAILGSDSFVPKSPRNGYVHMFDWSSSARSFFSLGLYIPKWARADYKYVRGAGRIESEKFQANEWKSNYYNPAFDNCLPEDGYWAAKKVMAFTNDNIRAIAGTAELSNPEAFEYLVKTLIERRDKIGQFWFEQVLPLDYFRVTDGAIEFDNLAVKFGFQQPQTLTYQWHSFDNATGAKSPLTAVSSASVPAAREPYLAVDVRGSNPRKTVTAYLKRQGGDYRVIGVERTW